MPFAKKEDAFMRNGKLKKGYREITDKNGRIRYMYSLVGLPDLSKLPCIIQPEKDLETAQDIQDKKTNK